MFAFLNLPNKKGFTLIGLIIVIVVLGILAVAAFPNFVNLSEEAKKSSFDECAATGVSLDWMSDTCVQLAIARLNLDGPALV